jgi:hypothetical protein
VTHICAPGDTIRVTAQDVTLLNSTFVEQAITAGLSGTVLIEHWDTGIDVGLATPMVLNNGNDWYLDLDAPDDEGRYRIVVVLTASGAQRTLQGELVVEMPPT